VSCAYLMPRFGPPAIYTEEPCIACLLEGGHKGVHLVKILEHGQHWQYYLWEADECASDDEGGCYAAGQDYCECFTYRPVSDAEAQEILAQSGTKGAPA
jgi:hypothetical protein